MVPYQCTPGASLARCKELCSAAGESECTGFTMDEGPSSAGNDNVCSFYRGTRPGSLAIGSGDGVSWHLAPKGASSCDHGRQAEDYECKAAIEALEDLLASELSGLICPREV